VSAQPSALRRLSRRQRPATGSEPQSGGVVQLVMTVPDEADDVECPNCGYMHKPFKLDEPPPPLDAKQ